MSASTRAPSLAARCESRIASTFRSMAEVEAHCASESAALSRRKDELLLELAAVSDALEELSVCARRVREARAELADDVAESVGEDAVGKMLIHSAAPVAEPTVSESGATATAAPAAAAPIGAAASRDALTRRQVYIGSLPRGPRVTASGISAAIDEALGAGRCEAVKLCAGGLYAFVTLVDEAAACGLGGERQLKYSDLRG